MYYYTFLILIGSILLLGIAQFWLAFIDYANYKIVVIFFIFSFLIAKIPENLKKNLTVNEASRFFVPLLAILFGFCGSATITTLTSFILILFIVGTSWIYYTKFYRTRHFLTFIFFSLFIILLMPGISAAYFLGCSFIFVLLYFYKRQQCFLDFLILSFLGFSISFLFFKLCLLYEIKLIILSTSKDMFYFTGNPNCLTVTGKIILQSTYLPYPSSQLQFLLNLYGFSDVITLVTKFHSVNNITNFIALYAYTISWIADFFSFIEIYLIVT